MNDERKVSVEEAMSVIASAMMEDGPEDKGSLAHSWHCNIAMMCYDSIREAAGEIPHEQAHLIGNDAASRFMALCFDVNTSL